MGLDYVAKLNKKKKQAKVNQKLKGQKTYSGRGKRGCWSDPTELRRRGWSKSEGVWEKGAVEKGERSVGRWCTNVQENHGNHEKLVWGQEFKPKKGKSG